MIAYCRIGERSSHTWFVLSELLGYSDVKNLDGSWTEYGSLVGVPLAVGAEAGPLEHRYRAAVASSVSWLLIALGAATAAPLAMFVPRGLIVSIAGWR